MPARVDSLAPEALTSEAICRTNGELQDRCYSELML